MHCKRPRPSTQVLTAPTVAILLILSMCNLPSISPHLKWTLILLEKCIDDVPSFHCSWAPAMPPCINTNPGSEASSQVPTPYYSDAQSTGRGSVSTWQPLPVALQSRPRPYRLTWPLFPTSSTSIHAISTLLLQHTAINSYCYYCSYKCYNLHKHQF